MTTFHEHPFLSQSVSEHTLAMLNNYKKWAFDARTFMLVSHSKMLDEIQKGVGRYAEYPETRKEFVRACVYVEMLNKVCVLIEDFASLSYALLGDLRDFPAVMLAQKNPRKILKEFDKEKWCTLLRYADVEDLPLSHDEKIFLGTIRDRNIEHCQNLVSLFADFLNLYWYFYVKHKHGNTLIYGLQRLNLDGEPTMFIPVIYDTRSVQNISGIFVNEPIFAKWQIMLNAVVTLSKDMAERTLLLILRNGALLVERYIYFTLDKNKEAQLDNIVAKCDATVTTHPVNDVFPLAIPQSLIKKHRDFYNRFDALTKH